jgi:hypothetical protein
MSNEPFDPRRLGDTRIDTAEARKQLAPIIGILLSYIPDDQHAAVLNDVARMLDQLDETAHPAEPGSIVLSSDAAADLLRAILRDTFPPTP